MLEQLVFKYLMDDNIYNISPKATRGVSFFKKYPFALSIFLSNLYSPLHDLHNILIKNNVLNRNGRPYPMNYLSIYRSFIKDILKYLENNNILNKTDFGYVEISTKNDEINSKDDNKQTNNDNTKKK